MKRGLTAEDVKVGRAVPGAPIDGASVNGGLGTARPTIFTVEGVEQRGFGPKRVLARIGGSSIAVSFMASGPGAARRPR